ncbi:phosphoesterase-domain-containing protein [Dacryopinax primogenitus]|uniref:Phosphoesterase-domain-containing protein n=1 Tax=Dacryopinax primogenitus (strain DJM 731) TaxID=1858805 RepID=M5G3Q6_DACPD|nr:phosphoesterase-domain-containing protein [Dacryopinax primogenitus]EJU00487.1 phosphoesterase-domain-containing protein [Dacryopinax primogenitus]
MISFLLSIVAFFSVAALGASLADIDHVVLFMQENRAFDHYFGTLYGVRGFADPNAQINANGRSVFYQQVNASLSNATDYLLPWYINAQGGEFLNGTQCMDAGSNGFGSNHAAFGNGSNDLWALQNTPQSLAYFKRQDIPIQFAITDAWTVGDMYQQGVVASTNPNRVLWQSGSINIPGGNVNSTQGPVLDNNVTPGCDTLSLENYLTGATVNTYQNISCFPFDWRTVNEYLQDLNVSYWVYQACDNFGDNGLTSFARYIWDSSNTVNDTVNDLVIRSMTMDWTGSGAWSGGLDHFKADAAAGTLPTVSWIIGPAELSEHPPYTPRQGAWLQKEVINAVQNSPKYNKTILIISFDETGGWADHVIPFHSPEGTPGEWINNPFTNTSTFSGPGFRLPFYAISPYSRGGNVFTEPADHTSQIMFVEKFLAAKGIDFKSAEINTWRREHMSDLTAMFDFSTIDPSYYTLPEGETPYQDALTGLLYGAEFCEFKYAGSIHAQVPYGKQNATIELAVEAGFRSVRGSITEGRYLVFESASLALADCAGALAVSSSQPRKQTDPSQRWIIHAIDSTMATATVFKISTPAGQYITSALGLTDVSRAGTWNITHAAESVGTYWVQETGSGMYLTLTDAEPVLGTDPAPFKLFSVTF